MIKKIALWGSLIVLIGIGVFALGRLSGEAPAPQGPPAYSLSPGTTGMFGGAGYMFDYNAVNPLSMDNIATTVERFLVRLNTPDLAVAQLREFQFVYQAEIIERSTGQHAFGLMIGKATAEISPKAGPNVFWNTRYGSLIAEIGGGYGMVGRLLSQDTKPADMPISEVEARRIAEEAVTAVDPNLSLGNEADTFYGFYEYHIQQGGELVGELDVNGYSGQVWYKAWGEPQIDAKNLMSQ